jgi:hypothetical protein
MHSSFRKKILVSVLSLAAVAAITLISSRAQAQDRPFGLGLMLGNPTGLSAKWYLGKPFALQGGLGFIDDDFDRGDDDGFHLFVDAVWHPVILANTSSLTLPLYFGVGGRLIDDDDDYGCGGNVCHDDDTYIGVRVPVGILLDFKRVPLDVFFELALVVDFIEFDDDSDFDEDHDRAHLNGAIGARYYF